MHPSRVPVVAVFAALTFGAATFPAQSAAPSEGIGNAPVRPEIYAPVTLSADLAPLSAK